MAMARSAAPRAGLLSRVPSPTLVVSGIASVQFGSALAATLFARIGPGGAVLLRLLTATIALCLIWPPRLRQIARRDLILACGFGLILAAMNLTFYHAIQRIPLGVAVTIEFIGPLGVAVLGSRRPLDLLWVLLAVGGILALTHGDLHSLNLLGLLLALTAGGLWGAYILVNARLGRAFSDGTGLAVAMGVATLLALPVGLAEGGAHLLSAHVLLLGAAVGMLSSAIPYSFELEALRRIATRVFGVLMSLEPAIAALAGFIVLGQALSTREGAGIALVIAASAGASISASRRPPAAPIDV
jgi:inner membrane transporter RhtA